MSKLLLELNILLAEWHLYSEKTREFREKALASHNEHLVEIFSESHLIAKARMNELRQLIILKNGIPVSSFEDRITDVPTAVSKNYSDEEMVKVMYAHQVIIVKQLDQIMEIVDAQNEGLLMDAIQKFKGELLQNGGFNKNIKPKKRA